jgi:hypothetical protein
MPKIDEFQIQRALCIWLDGQWDKVRGVWRIPPAKLPDCEYWAIPNGGKRGGFEAKRLVESGVKAGVHDLHFLRGGRLFGLEMKDEGGELSPAQKIMHPRLLAAGMAASAVCHSLPAAKAQLFAWGLTVSHC